MADINKGVLRHEIRQLLNGADDLGPGRVGPQMKLRLRFTMTRAAELLQQIADGNGARLYELPALSYSAGDTTHLRVYQDPR